MCNCEKISTCGEYIFATCTKYEGTLPSFSQYFENCDNNVEDLIEELYTLVNTTPPEPIQYYNGEGLRLADTTFSVNFGTTSTTVKRGDWKPDWNTDILNKPTIPEQVNIIQGNNIQVTGTYPNIRIDSTSTGEENTIERITLGGSVAPINSKTVAIPIASQAVLGVVKVGNTLEISPDGTLNSKTSQTNLTPGSGITITDNVIINTAPNVNHTGEVTGSGFLTITNNAVGNSKLSQMSPFTFKGNATNTLSNPTDVTLPTLKTLLDITNQTLVYNSYPQTVNLNNRLHTAVFCEVGVTQGDVIIPDGQFDGQIVFIGYNQLKVSEDNRLVGKFIVWSDGNTSALTNIITNAGYVVNGQAIYWSTEKSAWIVPRRGV